MGGGGFMIRGGEKSQSYRTYSRDWKGPLKQADCSAWGRGGQQRGTPARAARVSVRSSSLQVSRHGFTPRAAHPRLSLCAELPPLPSHVSPHVSPHGSPPTALPSALLPHLSSHPRLPASLSVSPPFPSFPIPLPALPARWQHTPPCAALAPVPEVAVAAAAAGPG